MPRSAAPPAGPSAALPPGREVRAEPVHKESHARTIVKSLTWRAGGLVMTVAAAWAITGKAEVAGAIGLVDTVLKIGAFYLHERLWLKIRFGRPRPPEYHI